MVRLRSVARFFSVLATGPSNTITYVDLLYPVTSPTLSGSRISTPLTPILAFILSADPITITLQSLKLSLSPPLSQAAIDSQIWYQVPPGSMGH